MIMKRLLYVHAESINILIISRLSIEQGDLAGIRTKIIEVWLTALCDWDTSTLGHWSSLASSSSYKNLII